MKWIKKILRIIAIILPAYCIFFMPGVTHAVSYSVDKIPISIPYNSAGAYTLLEPFHLKFVPYVENNQPIRYQHPNAFYFTSTAVNNNDVWFCRYQSGHNAMQSTISSVDYDFGYYLPDLTYSDQHFAICNSLQNQLQYTNLPAYALGTPNYSAWNNYRYQYDGFYLNDSYTEDGLNMHARLDFQEIFKGYNIPESIIEMTIPLGISTEKNITLNTPVGVEGEYFLMGRDIANIPDPAFAGNYYVKMSGFLSDSAWTSGQSTTETYTCETRSEKEDDYLYHFYFTCSGISHNNYDYNYPVGFTLYAENSDSPLFTYPSRMFVFDHINIYFNNDRTPAGSWSGRVEGGETINSPGNILNPDYGQDTTEPDWFTSLVNQFQFTVLNPFAPIFDLFTAGDSCVQIPTIAGMLHAPEDEYCPWFDATTRNIVTPVVAISSVMLVFGFVVRWLGSDSGNMFADGPNQHINIKGGK